MKANSTLKYIVPCLSALAVAMGQAYAESGASTVSGEITPKAVYFNSHGGAPNWVQSYNSQKAWSGSRSNGFYGDFDLDLTIGNLLSIERQGFGADNHRGKFSGGNAAFGIKGYYSHYRSRTGALDYANRPGTANNPTDPAYVPTTTTEANSGFISQFNDDSAARTDFRVERTRYGLAVKLKPELLGKGSSLTLGFDGYERDGNKFATWVAGNSDFGPPNPALQRVPERWRGYDKDVDERMGKLSLNFTASPGGLFQFAYDTSYEKFDNKARTSLIGDFAAFLQNGVTVRNPDTPLHFAPDSTLSTHAIRLSKTYGSTAVAMGYGMSTLKQDSRSAEQAAVGFRGEIGTQNAFITATHRYSPTLSFDGHVKYRNRDNDSTDTPSGILDRNVRDEWGVRIARLESLDYGISATFSGLPAKSSLTAGWKREDTDRDLEYNFISATSNIGVLPSVSLYGEETVSDEVYLRWVARPIKGMTLRISPSYVWADKTALITQAEKAFELKTHLSYAVSSEMLVSGYYNYKDKENGDQRFVDTIKPTGGPVVLGNAFKQKADNTFHSAGLNLGYTPDEWTSLGVSVDWAQNDFDSFFFGTNSRRFETPILFDQRGAASFKVDTWSLTFNGDYQPTDQLKLSASYTWQRSDGKTRTTGLQAAGDAPETLSDKIDNTLQSLSFGAAYEVRENVTLRGLYIYDRYDDKAFRNLNGGQHTVMMGVSLGF
ncbi:MtrB/PioB family outer membrane beta-barrel protein [Rhodocyclaceae bacterium SMB388]